MTRRWGVGDPEPPSSEVRAVTGASGTVWERSKHGYYWWPPPCGRVRCWPDLLAADGPLTDDVQPVQGALFDLAGAS